MKVSSVELTPEKAVVIGSTAIISDLHLGMESVLQERGFALPRVQIREVIKSFEEIVEKYDIERLVIAGDFKHEFSRNMPYEWEDVEEFLSNFSELEILAVRGNHDNFLAAILAKRGIELVESVEIGGYTVVHGHKEIDSMKAGKIIMGHEHPVVRVRYEGGIYTFPCYLRYRDRGKEIIVLPAFSPIVSGSDVLSIDFFLSPLLPDVEDVEVYAIEDDVFYLGRVKELRRVVGEI
jgi:hypothetical protein